MVGRVSDATRSCLGYDNDVQGPSIESCADPCNLVLQAMQTNIGDAYAKGGLNMEALGVMRQTCRSTTPDEY